MQEMNRSIHSYILLLACVGVFAGCMHVEMGVESFSTYPDKGWQEAWSDLDAGRLPIHVTAFLEADHAAYGIPYVFYVTKDKLPHQLHFVFATTVDQKPSTVDITSLRVRHKGLFKQKYDLLDDKKSISGSFRLDDRGEERGETPYYRVNIPLPDAIRHRSSFDVDIGGRLWFGEQPVEFSQTIEVDFERECYVYPAFVAWGLSGL
jgi:hypothetical protein